MAVSQMYYVSDNLQSYLVLLVGSVNQLAYYLDGNIYRHLIQHNNRSHF